MKANDRDLLISCGLATLLVTFGMVVGLALGPLGFLIFLMLLGAGALCWALIGGKEQRR